ncbi:MAG: DegT/DnrJ/EryC1/StrS family aminotransferase [Novosphingobium sp.]|nr:DegT/DnrJ/EryC1/StrS family aminotransferase [Novosphingobium sp.]
MLPDIEIESICLTRDATLRDALVVLDKTGAGIVLLVDGKRGLVRTVTDGDIRRQMLAGIELDATLAMLPPREPHTIGPNASRKDALSEMDKESINQLPVVDAQGRVEGLLDRREIDAQILLSTPHMGSSELEFVEEAFKTNWIAPLGPNVDAFEREFCEKLGLSHAAALSSGTAALHLALKLLGVGQGDRVFCSSFTFVASVNPIAYEKGEPVFIDSEPGSWNMSPIALERAFEASKSEGWMPKAVIVVDIYGQSANMDPIVALCDHYGVPIIEDAAEAVGTLYKGRPSGSFGRISAFSFNGNKIITTSGGGMLTSDNPDFVNRARFLATQAREPMKHYEHHEIGYNYRMSNILAGVGRGQLQVLDERISARRAVFDAYRDGLSDIDGIDWMPEPEWSFSTRWLSCCTIDEGRLGIASQALHDALADDLIETRPVWRPMHCQPVFAGARYFQHGNESVSDKLFDSGLCLPSGSSMTKDEVRRVVEAVRNIVGLG